MNVARRSTQKIPIISILRLLSTKQPNPTTVEDIDAEQLAQRDAAIEASRNKSRLYPDHYETFHDRNPYPEPVTEYHHSLRFKRRTYGKYGEASKVDPSVLWPTKQELAERKEYEAVAYPFTIQEMVEKVKAKKEEEAKYRREREALILANMEKNEQWKAQFHEKVRKRAAEQLEAKEKRDRLVEEVRRHFGYKIDPRDDRFREMLEKKEKEAKKAKKEEKQKEREAKMLEMTMKAEEAVKAGPSKMAEEPDSDDEEAPKKS